MTTCDMPLIVDDCGNINVHGREGLTIALEGSDGDDISAADIKFLTSSGLSITPDANPDDPLGRLLKLTDVQVQALPPVGVKFALMDYEGEEPFCRWGGVIRRWGW